MAVVNKKLAYEDDVVTKALFGEHTILKADTDDTPEALPVSEGTLIGRIAEGEIDQLAPGTVRTLLNVDEVMPIPLTTEGKLIAIPTIAWTEVENGVTVTQYTNYTRLRVADAAGAEDGRAHIESFGLAPANARKRVNWDKELFIQFQVIRGGVEATSPPLCYIQLKVGNAAGGLAANGIGIRIADDGNDPHTADRKLYGESYGAGASDEVVDLSLTLLDGACSTVGIHHKPGEFIKWYVNGVLKGTQSNTDHIPAGISASNYSIVVSVDKAATDPDGIRDLFVGWFLIWQAH